MAEIISINGKKFIYVHGRPHIIFDYEECIRLKNNECSFIRSFGTIITNSNFVVPTSDIKQIRICRNWIINNKTILDIFKNNKNIINIKYITHPVSFLNLKWNELPNQIIKSDEIETKETLKIDPEIIPDTIVNKMEPPKENINLCFVGGVSTGKSTILNAVFCEQLTQCKIKRTTMVPTIYIENDESFSDYNESDIFKTIAEKNKEMIEKTENGEKLTKEDYKELVFNVGKLDINILPDSFVNVYDIPGLNDARTKNIYYEYLETNFHKFNLVIFLVDIHSGLNTSDEIDILNFITNNTKYQMEKNNRKIYTLVVVNKADDMQLNEETNQLEFTGELKEMYEQVQKTICDEFSRKDVSSQLIDIIPLCAIDAYLYRMVKKHGRKFKLSPEQILKIGINENGKKFSTLKPDVQEKKVYEILNDDTFIDTMIQLSGFGQFETQLHTFLNQNGVDKQIRIDNILYDLRKLPDIITYMNSIIDPLGWFKFKEAEMMVNEYCKIYNKIEKISEDNYYQLIKDFACKIETVVKNRTENYNGKICNLLLNYKLFITHITSIYFTHLKEENDIKYPTYLQNKVVDMILNEFDGHIDTKVVVNAFDNLVEIDRFNIDTVKGLMERLISDARKEKTILVDSDIELWLELFDKLKELLLPSTPKNKEKIKYGCWEKRLIDQFIRFVIINQINSNHYSDEIMIQKKMMYYRYREVEIYHYLDQYFNIRKIDIEIFVRGYRRLDTNTSCKEFMLDRYYLSQLTEYIPK